MLLLLLLQLLGLQTSLQLQASPPPGRCDIPQRLDVYTTCTSCAAVTSSLCPRGFTNGGVSNCSYVVLIGAKENLLDGCHRLCVKNFLQPQCCPQYWGPLCLPCPSWSGKTCNFHGTCMDGDLGNGTCVCDEGFSGFACQTCSKENTFGNDCDKACDCEHGTCDQGPEGSGQCFCQPPYTGKRCDQVNNRCSACSPYSYCSGEGEAATCECLPGYTKTPKNKCASMCVSSSCDVNAQCSTQGSKVSCACKADFDGDGRVCVPKNPCTVNNGGCPLNSTVCIFKGPNKVACECMSGMIPVGGTAESGCRLLSACASDTCHSSAVCQTGLDGKARCVCMPGEISDGRRCYGNLMERLQDLNRNGAQKGKLTGALDLFAKGCFSLMSHDGLFTAFVPLLQTSLTSVDEQKVCRNHLILGQHLLRDMTDGRQFNMYGGAKLRSKDNKRFIMLHDPTRTYAVVQADLPAANGVIHIIDRPIAGTPDDWPAAFPIPAGEVNKFSTMNIGEVVRKEPAFNRFLSLVDNCGAALPLNGPGPLTVFIPSNLAVDNARDGSILYMLNHAKAKLQQLLRNHIYTKGSLTSDDLTSLPHIETTANQLLSISTSADGDILLGDKGVRVLMPNNRALNGIIHVVDGLLYPPTILPIMPHRCDHIQIQITQGPCVHCSYLYETSCPDGSTELNTHLIGCDYTPSPLHRSPSKGCAKNCNVTTRTPECCDGFFGPDCKPCIGGFQHPCYDKGKCFDGIRGNGSCSCQSPFEGVACHICSDPAKHGEHCDEECHCLHGVCDNRPGSGGVCRRGSCLEGFSGERCDKTASPCNADGLMEHCHINAYCTHNGLRSTCVCRDGYEGDGHSCTAINRCLKSSRGGCHANAECVYLSPGNVSCVCVEGWTGDGRVCVEINNCQTAERGGCSPNADCNHIGPGQSECVCKTGYMGNGADCDLVNPCFSKNGGCHALAKCNQVEDGNRTCTCPDGYEGDGIICYGTLMEELDMNPIFSGLYYMIHRYPQAAEDLSGNVTVLVPSRPVQQNMSDADFIFWNTRHHLPHILRAHFLPGRYSVEDMESLIGQKLPSMHVPTQWEIQNSSKGILIGGAAVVTRNQPAINGYFHVIDKILFPSRSDLPPEPLTLKAFLESSPNFSLFHQYALMYNLSGEIQQTEFTLLLPTDDAIRQYLSEGNATQLDADVFKYHVIRKQLLFPERLYDGLLVSTLLGADYQVQFHLDSNNQTLVNDVPLDGTFSETQFGVIIVLPRVLPVRRNRCSQEVMLQVNGRCTACDGPPRCLNRYQPITMQFPENMKPNCRYRKRVGIRRKSMPGCVIKCLQVAKDQSCCPGYYGHECFKCPGDVGSWCSNHGQCQDGLRGNGECRCYEGFHGTACEDCEPGRYGVNCTSKCACDHGKCDDGLSGSGRCDCHKGWKGASCSIEIKDDACGGVCDENANCITGPQGSAAACVCVAGYKGNGSVCQEVNLCSLSNGGCSPFATCAAVSAGVRTCTCNRGYTGDGVVCLGQLCHPYTSTMLAFPVKFPAFRPLRVGGLALFQKWTAAWLTTEAATSRPTASEQDLTPWRAGARWASKGAAASVTPVTLAEPYVCVRTLMCARVCFCVFTFFYVFMIVCVQNNGGCSKYARCEYLGLGQRNCTCFRDHIGDGIDCRGNTNAEVSRNPENAFFRYMFSQSDYLSLYGDGPFTVFVPIDNDTYPDVSEWKLFGRISDLVRYHIVSCEKLTLNDLQSTQQAIATSGHMLKFSLHQGSVWINNASRIIRSDYTTFNGVIHHISNMLTPYRLSSKQRVTKMNFTAAAQFYGYSGFYQLIERAGLLPVLQSSIHQPFTMFWPSDRALSSLPPERQRWLSSPDHQEELAATVKAHIIRSARVMGISRPNKYSSFRTMHGSRIKYSCDKNLVGNILINENAARVVERHMSFDEGVAYGIDQLLEPPGQGAHCDSVENRTTFGRCGRCLFPPPCPIRHQDTGRMESCMRSRSKYSLGYMRWAGELDDPFSSVRTFGCKRVCRFPGWVQKCCKNHFGRDCQVCPGGVESPCSGHGECSDGIRGTGKCNCPAGFQGDACETCTPGHYGANCTACECGQQGTCDEGMEGSGQCVCRPGWKGDRCQIDLGSIPEECRLCHAQADCFPGMGCQCKSGFQGNGTMCTPEPPPNLCEEYNGGCHQDADCTQTGLRVNCTCRSGYHGDGHVCDAINRCVEETNGGCSDFASCTFTGPNERKCECLAGYVGNGIQCLEKVVPPVDRCLEDNGGCHPVASCKDLHYHANTAGVFHVRSPEGKYKMNFSQADAACQADGGVLASFKQLGDAQQLGMHLCVAGWMEGGKVGYPTRFPSMRCGENHIGVVLYKDPVDQSSTYDAYCYRLSDVECKCPDGFEGDGIFCNSVLINVLAAYGNFSLFYKSLLDYSGLSTQGQGLVDFLSQRQSEVTLFVPHDDGFSPGQVLSGRDVEYHISANHVRRAFKELRHQEVIPSRLGFDLSVTHGNNESCKLVNQRLLLAWDIPAVNGIIHIIEAPLTAPPPQVSRHAAHGHAHSSGTVSAILVSLLLTAVAAGIGYYVFKHKTDAFRFQYFKNDDEDNATGSPSKPALVSIPNPLYSGSRAFAEPFGETSQRVEPEEPEEPPKILDLD
ncbi:stabilin-1 isoform X3 [Syngnathus scovelli]|uniref:stabilin-1 isoform X3 n=1 Tax=Syngnathus scovelli TaxID=161590 RepID=UPI00211075C8|nr:stabilin-1 isoform X3 [Syngnathus scovelli]